MAASLAEILAMPSSEIDELYQRNADEAAKHGRKDIKFAVDPTASVVDIKRAQLAVHAAHADGLTRPLEGI